MKQLWPENLTFSLLLQITHENACFVVVTPLFFSFLCFLRNSLYSFSFLPAIFLSFIQFFLRPFGFSCFVGQLSCLGCSCVLILSTSPFLASMPRPGSRPGLPVGSQHAVGCSTLVACHARACLVQAVPHLAVWLL